MTIKITDCCGCGKEVSRWTKHLNPEPGQFWHPNCWMRIDWHVDAEPRPRPMTTAEKVAYVESNQIADV
jgi:hypothetical protein